MAPKATPSKIEISRRNIAKPSPLRKRMASAKKLDPKDINKETLKTPIKKVPLAPKTPSKENATPAPQSATKKVPTWKRRPKAAHSGVPVPEKMRKLMEKQLKEQIAK